MNTRAILIAFLLWPWLSSAQSTFPPEVTRFVEGRDSCDHFRGEEPYDAERRKFLEDRMRELCTGTDRRLKALRLKYKREPKVLSKLNEYEPQIEAASK